MLTATIPPRTSNGATSLSPKLASIPAGALFQNSDKYEYQSGFGNEFASEALPNALPVGQNSPQKCPYGLYSEQLSGTSFTVPRAQNRRTWFYRIRPSANHKPYNIHPKPNMHLVSHFTPPHIHFTPNQLRWSPFETTNTTEKTFIEGLKTVCGSGDPASRHGLAVHVYLANKSMCKTSFYNADGDLLIVPQQGDLDIMTEMGPLFASPSEFVVIPRGIRFSVNVQGPVRGYVLEVYANGHFELPDLGLIGANGCANPRDFLYPKAQYIDKDEPWCIVTKYNGCLFSMTQDHCPYDVVAWHGNYAPYKYDMRRFVPVNAVGVDHCDPSIFTVLTVKTNTPGVALADFVLFPPRWAVQEHTFRAPYYHRNCMSEFMGLVYGNYEAKQGGFLPGGGSLHSIMTPHGPDTETVETERAKNTSLPERLPDSALAFMIESSLMLMTTKWAVDEHEDGGKCLQRDYYQAWMGVKKYFNENDA